MPLLQLATIVGSALLVLLMGFQASLALGLPLGRFAWGGKYKVLPCNLRRASALAIGILGFVLWVFLARGNVAYPGPNPLWVRIFVWLFAAYFLLNTAMNLVSTSRAERWTMTPVAATLTASFVAVAMA